MIITALFGAFDLDFFVLSGRGTFCSEKTLIILIKMYLFGHIILCKVLKLFSLTKKCQNRVDLLTCNVV